MAAITLDHLSGGRLRLGLGVSGPQVAEGWHGMPFDHPIERTREYVGIVRSVLRRDEPVTSDGPHYPLPLPGGSGKALKANVRPLRADVPVLLAAMGPRNVALAAEIADGWIPFLFSPERVDVFAPALAEGSARRDEAFTPLDVAPMVPVAIGPDLAECRDRLRPLIAFYVGAMGSRDANFYKDLVTAYGFGEVAERVQDAFLDGRRTEAAGHVTDAMIDELCLVGPAERAAIGSAPGGRRASRRCSRGRRTWRRSARSARPRRNGGRPERPLSGSGAWGPTEPRIQGLPHDPPGSVVR
jgi:F420-dependent oxidoreductase-like protein